MTGTLAPSELPRLGLAWCGQLGLVVASSLLVVAVLLGAGSPAPVLAVAAALAVLVGVLVRREVEIGLLALMFLCAPVDIGKALLTPTSLLVPDAPGLSMSLFDLPAFAWAAVWLIRRIWLERVVIKWSKADGLALALLGWIWIEAFRSPAADGLGFATAAAYSKFVLMFVAVSHGVRTRAHWRAVMVGCALIFFIQALQVVAQLATQSPLALPGSKLPDVESVVSLGSGGSAFRPMGFFNHPNALADYLVLLLPAPLCLVLLGSRRVPARLWFVALTMIAVGTALLAATLSRGGWISGGLAGVVCVAMFRRAGALSTRQIQVGALLASLAVVAALASTPRLLLRITEPDSRSLESRGLLAEQAFAMIKDQPLLGVGFGGYYRSARDYTPEGFSKVSAEYQRNLRQLVVHNHYLLLAAELGLPAMLLFVGLMLSLIAGVMPLRAWHDAGRFALAVGLAGALAGNLVFLSSDNYYADIRMAMLWLVAGLLQAATLERREAAEATAVRNAKLRVGQVIVKATPAT